jgi:hypothetical protein
VNSSPWINGIGALGVLAVLGLHAPILLAVIIFIYVTLIAIAAIVGSLHDDQKHRTDAQKVLKRLLSVGRRSSPSWTHELNRGQPHASITTQQPRDGDARPPEQVASARQTG